MIQLFSSAKWRCKRIGRQTISELLFHSGLAKLADAYAFRNSALILAYHRVVDPHELPFLPEAGMYVTKQAFQLQMEYLTKSFRVVPLSDIVESILHGEALPAKTCAITFDDGWGDNFLHAFPILKRLGIPATIFLCTGFIGNNRPFWSEEINHFMHFIMRDEDRFSAHMKRNRLILEAYKRYSSTEERVAFIIREMKLSGFQRIEDMLEQIREITRSDHCPGMPTMLSWTEIDVMAEHKITFGSHGVNHTILTSLSEGEVHRETRDSYSELFKRCKSFVPYFCYPNGSHNEVVRHAVRGAGYTCAFSNRTRRGFARLTDDPYDILRTCIDNDTTRTTAMFSCRINAFC